MKKQSIW